jgi:hypothetical protein
METSQLPTIRIACAAEFWTELPRRPESTHAQSTRMVSNAMCDDRRWAYVGRILMAGRAMH